MQPAEASVEIDSSSLKLIPRLTEADESSAVSAITAQTKLSGLICRSLSGQTLLWKITFLFSNHREEKKRPNGYEMKEYVFLTLFKDRMMKHPRSSALNRNRHLQMGRIL